MKRFEDRVALVTGGANGIGAAVVVRLIDEGARVIVADLEGESAASFAATHAGGRAFAVACDVRSTDSVNAAVAAGVEHFGRLDILVNVAGGSGPHPPHFADTLDDDWSAMIELNLTSTMRTIRACLRHLEVSQHAAVVTVSSVNGLAAFGEEAYAAAKAGLDGLHRNLAVKHGPAGVRFTIVAPGTTRTRVWDDQQGGADRLAALYPLGRVGEPSDIAAAVAFLASDDASWITGITLPVDGGALAGPLHLFRQTTSRRTDLSSPDLT